MLWDHTRTHCRSQGHTPSQLKRGDKVWVRATKQGYRSTVVSSFHDDPWQTFSSDPIRSQDSVVARPPLAVHPLRWTFAHAEVPSAFGSCGMVWPSLLFCGHTVRKIPPAVVAPDPKSALHRVLTTSHQHQQFKYGPIRRDVVREDCILTLCSSNNAAFSNVLPTRRTPLTFCKTLAGRLSLVPCFLYVRRGAQQSHKADLGPPQKFSEMQDHKDFETGSGPGDDDDERLLPLPYQATDGDPRSDAPSEHQASDDQEADPGPQFQAKPRH